MNGITSRVGAVILAAGMSTRMGQPKMLLPWGSATVIEKVVTALLEAEIAAPVVVTGSGHNQVCEILSKYAVRPVYNPRFADGEMLHSLQAGIAALPPGCQAAFIVLGDQPQIQAGTVKSLLKEYQGYPSNLIIPSYQMRRGHPWLIGNALWAEILALELPLTLRDFLRDHSAEIHYLTMDTPSILEDLDTPDEYRKYRP